MKDVRGDKLMELINIGWMFDIVANKRNSLDVDKFDYLCRDA